MSSFVRVLAGAGKARAQAEEGRMQAELERALETRLMESILEKCGG